MTKTNMPKNSTWNTEQAHLNRKEDTSLARYWRSTGLKSAETAWQIPITKDAIESTRQIFQDLDETLQTRLLDDFGIKTIEEFCDAIQEGAPSTSLLLEDHPVAQAQARMVEDNEPT